LSISELFRTVNLKEGVFRRVLPTCPPQRKKIAASQ
jgi:hypothetical protein